MSKSVRVSCTDPRTHMSKSVKVSQVNGKLKDFSTGPYLGKSPRFPINAQKQTTNIAASSDADSSKDCETRGKCIFFTILERRVKEGKKSEEGKEEKKEVSC